MFKPDASPLRTPRAGEMVRVEGKRGLFLVKQVHRDQMAADLMQRAGKREVLDEAVPFSLIRTVPPLASRAIRQFLAANLGKGRTGTTRPPS